ncbi:hypothetical protein ACFWP2_29135 [Kitasatospora sp. NPDC058444]|uniref:hypothetical protein n=1 Tax=Kitasatospora sp. NPDC058444 TaxID=3346504 RepID=UPI00364FFA82
MSGVDDLYRLPLATALTAGFGAFLYHVVPIPSWRATRLGWLRPVLWGAGLGAAIGVVRCTPLLRHAAWVVLIDHPWWIDPAVCVVAAAAVAALAVQIRRRWGDNPEHTDQP